MQIDSARTPTGKTTRALPSVSCCSFCSSANDSRKRLGLPARRSRPRLFRSSQPILSAQHISNDTGFASACCITGKTFSNQLRSVFARASLLLYRPN